MAHQAPLGVNMSRLQQDLTALFQIGYDPVGKGVTRLGFSQEDREAREWLIAQFKAAGLHAEMDSAGNVVGRQQPAPPEKVVGIGSHIDTVISGGMFDGSLGVLAGLEILRVFKEHQIKPDIPIQVYAFAEEEGRFGGMLGSQALIGEITPEWLFSAHDVNQVLLKDEMEKFGLEPMAVLNARVEPAFLQAFFELHIEQGPELDKLGKPIGVVDSISGVFKWIVRLIGKSSHAGTGGLRPRDPPPDQRGRHREKPADSRQGGTETGSCTYYPRRGRIYPGGERYQQRSDANPGRGLPQGAISHRQATSTDV